MSQLSEAPTIQAELPGAPDTRLHGRWLVLARMLWIAMFLLALVGLLL